jgi:outer membrane receptor protein involved in Fe transport
MTKTIKTALGLAVLLGVLPGAARGDDDAELLAPAADAGMSLKLSGFADFRWAKFYSNGDPRWQQRGIPENASFSVGNINLYVDGRLDQSFRSFLEIRFSYLPSGTGLQGSSDPMAGQTGLYTSTLGWDYAELRAKSQWGGVVIERAWLEYRLDQALTLRAGQFLTPYGVWNVDHGSPTLVDIAPPFPIGQELFPRSQVGLEAYGSFFLGDARLGYHATISNGRIGSNPQYLDFDQNLGAGGRLFLETGEVGELKIGASAYGGKFTDKRQGLEYEAVPATGIPVGFLVPKTVIQTGDEVGVAGDLRWDLGRLTVIGEYIEQHLSGELQTVQDKTVQNNAPVVTKQPAFTKRGWYGLLGYRLVGAFMPFAVYQYINDSRGEWLHDRKQEAYAWTAGVNWRLRPNVVLKASYTHAWWPKTPKDLENKDPLSWFATQVAWAF